MLRRINEKNIEVTHWCDLIDEGKFNFITDLSTVLIQINIAIIKLQHQIKLQNELNKINREQHEIFEKQIKVAPIQSFITKIGQRLSKLEKLTSADDYEYQTIPAKTKLVKKQSTASKDKKAGE